MLLSTWKMALEKTPLPQPSKILSQTILGATATATTVTTNITVGTGISTKDSGYLSTQPIPQLSISTASTNSSMTSNSGLNVPSSSSSTSNQGEARKPETPITTTLHLVEGFALIMLCNYRQAPRKLAVNILKEVKMILKLLGSPETELPLIDVIDKCCPQVINYHIIFSSIL